MALAQLQDEYLFDADSHVLEPPDMWDNYLEAKFKDRAIRITKDAGGVEQLWVDGEIIMRNRLAAIGGVGMDTSKLLEPLGKLTYMDSAPPASMSGHERLKLYEDWGLGGGLVLPTIGILWDKDDAPLANAYCRAYNDWVYDFQAPDRERMVIAAHLNLRDIPNAIKELDRNLARGFKGVFLPPERVDGKGFAHPHFDPLWARIEEAGVPLLPHVIVRTQRLVTGFAGDWYNAGQVNLTFSFAMGGASQLMPALVSMVLDGTFDKFPRLKVCSIEAGAGWAPYAMDRMDEKYKRFKWQSPLKLDLPSDYFRRNIWAVAEPEERTIGSVLDILGEDRVLWGSDYPHIDSDLEAVSMIRHSVAGLSEARKHAVLGGNAKKLFGIK
ncbi:MAG: amidohydrolase family protein [Alphaproteobacteria bacterium]